MQAHMFPRIGFTNGNIIEKYFRIHFLSSLSAKNDHLSFFYWIRVEEPIFHSKANLFFPVEIHLDPVAVYFMRNSLVSHFVESFWNVKEYPSNFVILIKAGKYFMSNG